MDIPAKLTALGIQDTGRRQTKKNTMQKNKKKDKQRAPHQSPGVNPGVREGQAVSVSYKTPVMLHA